MNKEALQFLGVVLVIIMFFILAIFFSREVDRKSCLSKYADFQPEYHGMFIGCLVRVGDKTVPVESLRLID